MTGGRMRAPSPVGEAEELAEAGDPAEAEERPSPASRPSAARGRNSRSRSRPRCSLHRSWNNTKGSSPTRLHHAADSHKRSIMCYAAHAAQLGANRKSGAPRGTPPVEALEGRASYIMPPMPPAGIAGASSSGSATITSVVTMRLPMEAAFCRALRETIVGSVTPADTRSS
jgi:hypothetical protein